MTAVVFLALATSSICRPHFHALPARIRPTDTGTGGHSQTIGKLRFVILDVTNVDDLVLHLRNLVPTKPALPSSQVEGVDGIVNQ